MCGAEIILKYNDLVKFLGEYIERQGLDSTKKECEKFIDEFKKKNKKLPNLDELWTAAVNFAKLQKMDKKDLKKIKEKPEIDLDQQIEKLKKKKLEEAQKKKTEKVPEPVAKIEDKKSIEVKSETDKRIEEMKKKREELTTKIAQAPSKKEEKKISINLDDEEEEEEEASVPEKLDIKFDEIEEESAEPKLTIPVAPPMAPKDSKSSKKAEASDGVICPTCGTKNPLGSKFCQEDGTPL